MKKLLLSIFTFLFMFIFIGSVNAKENVEISDVTVSEKSDKVTASISSFNGLTFNAKESFYEVGDYATYKVTLKNNTNKELPIENISDNLKNKYVETSYKYTQDVMKPGETYIFYATIKYKKEIKIDSVNVNFPIKISIKYKNGDSTTLVVNPDTKDNVLLYASLFVVSIISIILLKNKKKKLLAGLIALLVIPTVGNAVNDQLTANMNNNVGIYKKVAILKKGSEVNKTFKELALDNMTSAETSTSVIDNNIKHIVRSKELPNDIAITNNNKISSDKSVVPVYAWYKDGTIYYYSETEKVLLNEDSACLFCNLSKVEDIDMSIFDTSNVVSLRSMFYGCESLKNIDLSNFDTKKVTNMYAMFYNCKSLEKLDVSNFDTSKVTTMRGMFFLCNNLKSLDVSNFDTSSVTDMGLMFADCNNLQSIDVSKFNTSNVTDMSAMFYDCYALQTIDTSKFDTSKVTDMSWMFAATAGKVMKFKELDLSNFNTSNVTNMEGMFQNATYLKKLNVSSFDTSKVTTMKWMFCDLSYITELDVSNFNTSNVTDMTSMFEDCRSLTSLDVSNFDTSKVTSMNSMFTGDEGPWKITSIDISNFDTSKVTDMYRMFYNWKNATKIYVSEKFVTNKVTNSKQMFTNAINLVGGNGTVFDSTKIDKEYARIDKEGIPGYFTIKN